MSEPTDASAPDSLSSDPDCWECGEYMCDEPSGPDEYPGSDYSEEPVRYSNGEIFLVAEDLAFKNLGVNWGHTRSYSNRVTEPGVGRNGNSWFVKEWPYLSPSDASANPVTICLIWVIQEALWFDWDAATSTYKARFFLRPKLRHDTAAQEFTLFDSDGRITTFYDFSASHGAKRGQFKSFTDSRGRVTTADYQGGDVIREFVQQVGLESSGYSYDYYPANPPTGAAGKLKEVLYKVNGTAVRRVRYTYYEPIDIYGSPGDLKLVTVEKPDGANWAALTNTYYRYYKAGDPNGVVHGLQFVLNPLGYQQMDDAFITPESASPEDLRRYAKHEFRYDSDRRVVDETVNSGTANYGFGFEESGFTHDFNHWKRKTTESLPDGSRRLVFTNYAGQVMLKVFIQMKGSTETNKRWYEYRKFDADGRTILEASFSAIATYHVDAPGLVTLDDLKEHQGLIHLTHYYPPNPGTDGAPFRVQYRKVKSGRLGDEIKLREWKYKSQTVDDNTRYVPGEEIVYRSSANFGSNPVATEFSYAWDHFHVAEKTTTLPRVPAEQNGPDDADTLVEAFDDFGRVTWHKDARGFNTHYEYLTAHEEATRQTEDASGAPWDTNPEAPHLNLITDHTLDDQGRIVETLGPVHPIAFSSTSDDIRRVRWTIYRDLERERWEADGCRTEVNGGYLFIGPVHIERYDEGGRLLESIQATRTNASGPLSPSNEFPQSSYIRWTLHLYTGHANVATRRVYHKIPTEGSGVLDTNFNDTHFQYDILHRIVREQSPGGTITRLVYHPLGWVLSKWIGTNDIGGDDRNPAGPRPWPRSPNNMVKVEEYRYDGGSSGGDGNLTRLTQYATATDPRVTSYSYDFRNRRTSQNGEIDFFESYTYDNQDRIIETLRKDTTSNGTLVARSETLYDNRDRVYCTRKYGINPSNGTGTISLADNTWSDPVGNVIKQQPAGSNAFTKIEYDAFNRPIATYLAFDPSEVSGAPNGALSNDTVIEQTETTYDGAGNATVQLQRLRFHNTTGTGPLEGPIGTQRAARILYSVHFPDPLGRMRATANYGSRKWTTTNPPALIPTRSDTILVTSVFYNDRGEATETTDPAWRVQKTFYDHAGRREKEVQNFIPNPNATAHDQNKTTSFTYTPDGALETLTAHNIVTTNQVTLWEYGTVLSNDCCIASSLLVRKKVYPDTATDRVVFKYNRLGQVTEMKDQRDVIHLYDYDKLGRLQHDRVTSLGPSGIVDGTVRRISYTYEVRGLARKITSVNNPAPNAGAILNEVLNEYNPFEQLIKQHQSHSGAVVPGTTPVVQYAYADGTATSNRPANTTRLEKLTYPNARELHYSYGALSTNDNQLSRVRALIDNDPAATPLVQYDYLGANTFVIVAYPQPQLELTYKVQGTEPPTYGGDQYTGLDRFGRIIDQRWLKTTTGAAVERLTYGYDPLSNRLWRINEVAPPGHDELYTYDALSQIKQLQRGTLDSPPDTISNRVWLEDFTYDPTGNWQHYRSQIDQTTAFEQDRTHNKVNAITAINNSSLLLGNDAAGNMTRIPQAGTWTSADDLIWDSWDRLAQFSRNGNTLAAYTYDGLARRTTATSGTASERNYFYSNLWQILEVRTGSGTVSERQFVWANRWVNDLALRDTQGGSNPRLYSLSDPMNVSAIATAGGTIVERYGYTGFGTTAVAAPNFSPRTTSNFGWETRFCGYRWDEDVQLFQVRHRYYAPPVGRWLSRDPLSTAGT